jgi:hypothetical protein
MRLYSQIAPAITEWLEELAVYAGHVECTIHGQMDAVRCARSPRCRAVVPSYQMRSQLLAAMLVRKAVPPRLFMVYNREQRSLAPPGAPFLADKPAQLREGVCATNAPLGRECWRCTNKHSDPATTHAHGRLFGRLLRPVWAFVSTCVHNLRDSG